MKRILFSALVFCLAATTVFAQKKIKDTGYVKYEITEIKSQDAMAGMLKGSTMETYIGKGQSRTCMNMMGGMVMIDTYSGKDGSAVTLMNMMGQKSKSVVSKEDVVKAQNDGAMKDMKFTYNKRKTKTIAGYKCHQAKTKMEDGSELILYVTNKILMSPSIGGQSGLNFVGLKGFPLEFSIQQQGMEMTFSAKEVEGKVKSSDFEYDDSGYKEMDPSELGNMGGGLGF
jgi:GLPGLI family protein